jgi:hypothetical protein
VLNNQNTYKEKRKKQLHEANKTYRSKMRENGMFYFCMWVPKSILEKVKKYIEELRKDE